MHKGWALKQRERLLGGVLLGSALGDSLGLGYEGLSRRRVRRWLGWLVPAGMGAGLAAACAAGMVLGAQQAGPAHSEGDAMVTAVSDDVAAAYFDEEA